MHANKQTSCVLTISATIFIVLSYLLYQQASRKPTPHTDVDSKAYLMNADFFYHDKSFSRLGHVPYYTLGYPLFIGALYLIGRSYPSTSSGRAAKKSEQAGTKSEQAGTKSKQSLVPAHPEPVEGSLSKDTSTPNNLLMLILAQVLLALASGLLIFLITRRFFGQSAAYISALLFSCNFGFLIFSQFVLTEVLLAFLLLLFFERFSAFLVTKNITILAIAGLILGISIIIKPAALYYPFCLFFFIITALWQTNWKKIFSATALFLIMFYLPITAYRVHNKIVFNSFTLGSLSEVNMLFWFFPHVLAEKNGTNSDYERIQLKQLEHTFGSQEVRNLLWHQITHNPQLIAYAWLKNTFKTWCGLYAANLKILVDETVYSGQFSFFRMPGSIYERVKLYVVGNTALFWVKMVSALECLWQLVRYFLIVIALGYLIHTKRFMILLFFLSYLSYFSLITGHDGCARFRMMFEGQLVVLTALGMWTLFIYKKNGVKA